MGDPERDFTPRAYQVDLYEKAVSENTIIYLPTGSGKTFIAVMLIRKYSNQLQLPYNEGGKRIIFIVNTVPLVGQQSDYIARHTGLTCRGYSGDMAVDYWSKEEWLKEMQETQVMVMVGDIFLNILNHGYMLLSSVALLIFDECHKGVGNHPMRSIMKCFERCDQKDHPRVLGLTATLLNSNVKVESVEKTIRALEITFHSRIATVESADSVKAYGNLEESFISYDPLRTFGGEDELMALVNYMLDTIQLVELKGSFDMNESSKELRPKSKNDSLRNVVEDTRTHITTMGLYGGSKAVLMHMIQLECMKKFCEDAPTVAMLEFLVTQMTKMRKIMADMMQDVSEIDQIYKFSSDQVLKLFSVLQHFNATKTTDQKFCCIIFVCRRTTAQIIYHILKNLRRLDERFEFVHPEYIIGYSNNPFKNPREALCLSKWNKESLLKFRSGQCNCIVATEVVDEGVDIPTCTLIVRYDLPSDFRSYIQSKGRARHRAGQYIMLVPRDDTFFPPRYASFRRVEGFLRRALVGHTDEREEITADDIHENLYKTEISPYVVVSEDGQRCTVTEISAISLINRYCINLFKSKFVNLTPTWTLQKIRNQEEPMSFKVSLTLPPISPLKQTVEGDVMNSIPLAKRSAALKACIELHKIGELTDRLMPIDMNVILENADHLFPNWINDLQEEVAFAGTSHRKQNHEIKHPSALYGAFPVADKPLYLHVICAKPTYSRPYENRMMVFYDLLNNDAGYGILSTKPMADIPSFPIFMNVGDLSVSVKVNHEKLNLSTNEIAELRQFHWNIFNDVLNVVKSFMAFDRANQGNSFLIVPTDTSGKIDWEVVNKYRTIEEVPFVDTTNIFDQELALVTPNYRSSSSVYVVTQVCEDIMAESSFPTEDYYSYVHYYMERHGLIIRNVKQQMLEVKAISKKINCIRPRGLKAGLSKRKRADLLEDFEEHFVGELCNRIVFPALYWLKASYLPSVLHRISQLLVAEDLRLRIVDEAQLGVAKLRSGCHWPPVIVKPLDPESTVDVQLEISGCVADDSLPLEATDTEVDLPGPEVDTLGLDSKLYPWTKEQEPANLFQDIESIQLIDIEYFHQFMSTPLSANDDILKKQRRSNVFASRLSVRAPPLEILTKKDPNGPSPAFVMQALTSKFAHDVFDLERLETLGDSLLKFAVSLYLFEAYPGYREGQLTVIKGKILGNRNLFYCGKVKEIPGRMKVDEFVPASNFMAPAFCAPRQLQQLLRSEMISPNVLFELTIPPEEQLTGLLSDHTLMMMEERVLSWNDSNTQTDMQAFLDVQQLPDKSVSDSVEALIGVYLSSLGLHGAVKLLMWFDILPSKLLLNELLQRPSASPRLNPGNPEIHMPNLGSMESRIGYKFKDRTYLLQAFTHPSFTPNTMTPSYERLEFLGDAILDFLITVHIYESCDYLSPGALTDLRSALVNNVTFACLAVKYGFHTGLMAYAPAIQEVVERFVKFQEERDYAVDDELLWILLDEDECRMAEYVDVPKILGDLFESVVGAIYLDTGKDLNEVWNVVYGLMHKEIATFSRNVPKQPVRVIHETPGAHPRFSKATSVDGAGSTMITLEVVIAGKPKIFHGFGANKKQAKCAAAKQALKCLRRNL